LKFYARPDEQITLSAQSIMLHVFNELLLAKCKASGNLTIIAEGTNANR
jgi:hypothetical protein